MDVDIAHGCEEDRAVLSTRKGAHRFQVGPVLALFLLLLPLLATAQGSGVPNERSLIFGTPFDGDWSLLAGAVQAPGSSYFKRMAPDAIKVAHGRLEKFSPYDETASAYFPYNELKAFEASEVAAGRAPIFVTATYKGKKRPVLFQAYLLPGTPPKTPAIHWEQAVNVRDERFIRFWIDNYARKVMDQTIPNMWMGLDDCRFFYAAYGVVDDNGNYVAGIPWDKPFAQNDDEFLDSLKYFFKRLHELAPDINVICNLGTLDDMERFPEVYQDVPGVMTEDITDFVDLPQAYLRLKNYQKVGWYQWLAAKNRVAILRSLIPTTDPNRLRTGLVTYLIIRGDRFLFAPQTEGTGVEISPTLFAPIRDALGLPNGALQSQREPGGLNDGYRLYWRSYAGGLVYLNLTGKSKTVTLPTDRAYYGRDGHPATQLTLSDLVGDYVLTSPP